MLKKIFRASIFICLFIFIFSSPLISGVSPSQAVQIGSESNEDNSMGIVKEEESSNSIDGSKTTAVPDLGDDQAFPFIPGFGKNSGKD